jgi:hypothetical protein
LRGRENKKGEEKFERGERTGKKKQAGVGGIWQRKTRNRGFYKEKKEERMGKNEEQRGKMKRERREIVL